MCLDDTIPMAGPSMSDSLDFKAEDEIKTTNTKHFRNIQSCKLSKDIRMYESLSSRKMKRGEISGQEFQM